MNSSIGAEGNETESDQWTTFGRPAGYVILSLSFLVGAPGNLLVIWTILQHVKQRSHTVLLILHLAVADLLVLITLPLWIYAFACSWVFGEAVCKAMVYIIHSCMYTSVFLITIMSVERFVAVRYPFSLMTWKRKEIMNTSLIVIWILAFLFGIPAILTHYVDELSGTQQCLFQEHSSWGQELAILLLETMVGLQTSEAAELQEQAEVSRFNTECGHCLCSVLATSSHSQPCQFCENSGVQQLSQPSAVCLGSKNFPLLPTPIELKGCQAHPQIRQKAPITLKKLRCEPFPAESGSMQCLNLTSSTSCKNGPWH